MNSHLRSGEHLQLHPIDTTSELKRTTGLPGAIPFRIGGMAADAFRKLIDVVDGVRQCRRTAG
ncbi:MAG TPA: hypothetical protein VKT27_09540 [Candidatus Binataceae bacterium]|nr:hypothetical protein [Candidatus Binataceae bacterium]